VSSCLLSKKKKKKEQGIEAKSIAPNMWKLESSRLVKSEIQENERKEIAKCNLLALHSFRKVGRCLSRRPFGGDVCLNVHGQLIGMELNHRSSSKGSTKVRL
jgi:hypothetical protein